jgi:uncharacterized protein YbjT (DUF2867 family)
MSSEHIKRIAIFGPTGLAGNGVLRACLRAPEIGTVVAITRRPLQIAGPKLLEVRCRDFKDLSPIANEVGRVDACFYCMGTTSAGKSEEQYRLVTMTYALEAARLLKSTSPLHTFHFLSGSGTRVGSRFLWARVKGETEKALKASGLAGIVCWRPGVILAEKLPEGRSVGIRAAYPIFRLMRFIPSLSIEAEALGFAMLQSELDGKREGTLENIAIRALAQRYRSCYPMSSHEPA